MASQTSIVPAVNQDSIDTYFRSVNQHPLLTAEEELKLAERLYYHEDIEAAKTLILSHLRFVVHVARGYTGYGLPLADIIQEGNIGLMKAVKRFNPEIGVRLVSFAVHWIKAEIHEYVLRNWRMVKVATTKAQRKLFFNLRKSKKRLGWFNQQEAQYIANELGVELSEVREMEARMSAQDTAFELPNQDTDESHLAPAYYLEDKQSDHAMNAESSNWQQHTQDRLLSALQDLDERSRDILQSRWLNDDKATLQELADTYNISAERVRQLEKNAMDKLKTKMAGLLEA